MTIFSQNKKAYFDYIIEDTYEAGIVLSGTEVKSIRQGRANLKEGYVIIKDGEVYLFGCNISHYTHGNIMNHEPLRIRKLLLHKSEIERLIGRTREKGYALVPIKLYLKKNRIKLEVGLAKGKKQFEKRESIKEREAKREIDVAMKAAKARGRE